MKTFLSILFLPLLLFSEYSHRMYDEAISSFEGSPSTIVNGVNVITGEYLLQEEDLQFNTPVPFSFTRFYSSLLIGPPPFHDLWGHNHECTLGRQRFYTQYIDLTVGEHTGGSRHFSESNKGKVSLHERAYRHGYTNTGGGELSGKNNPENYTFDLTDFAVSVHKGDGTTLHFGSPLNYMKRKWYQVLLSEKTPSGHTIEYTYQQEPYSYDRAIRTKNYDLRPHIKEITLKSPKGKTLAWIHSQFDTKTHSYTLTSSEGHHIHYNKTIANHNRFIKQRLLNSVETNSGIPTTFKYVNQKAFGQATFQRIHTLNKPNGRTLTLHYYPGWNSPDTGRIKHLQSPCGKNNTETFTHTFYYNIEVSRGSQYMQELKKGVTTVLDAYNNKTLYRYDTAKRLTNIERYQGEHLYTKESLEWSNNQSEQEGRLTRTRTENQNNQLLKQIDYTYDSKGNILQKTLSGDLCGTHSPSTCTETYTYTDDTFNLISSHTLANGVIIKNTYLPNTNLLTAQLHTKNGNILMRHFWEYDQDHLLTKETIDDGNTPEKNNLSSITFKKTIQHTLRQSDPGIGLPEKTEELFYNPKTQEDTLLRYTTKTYNQRGLVTHEQIYDAHHTLHTYTKTSYNPLSQPIYIQTPEGEWHYQYDANGNLLSQTDPENNIQQNTYDLINRLIKQETTDALTKETRSLSYTYDTNNKRTSSTDPYGHTTHYTYDSLGRKLTETYSDGTTKTYTYDPHDNLTNQTFPGEKGILTTYTLRGKPSLKYYPDDTTETFEYHPWGDLKKTKDRHNNTTHLTTDWQGRITEEKTYSETQQLIHHIKRTYSPFHLLSETDTIGNTTFYTYDIGGRLSTQTQKDKQGVLLTYCELTHDSFDRPIIQTHYSNKEKTNGTKTVTSYNTQNLPIEQLKTTLNNTLIFHTKARYNYKGTPTLKQNLTQSGWASHTITSNAWGEIISQTDPLNNTTTTTYNHLTTITTDPLGQQTRIQRNSWLLPEIVTKHSPNNTLLSKAHYLYDLHQNKKSETHSIIHKETLPTTHTINYTYDELNNLVTIDRQGQLTLHTYRADQLIKLTKPDGTTLHYTYTPKGQVARFYSSDNTLDYHYTYDLAGNLTHVQNTHCTYDPLGQLTQETLDNGLTIKKNYDLTGNLTQLTYPDHTSVEYTYEGELLKKIKKGSHIRTFDSYHPGGLLAHSTDNDTIDTRYTYDLNQRLTTLDGPIDSHLTYDPIGNLISQEISDPYSTRALTYTYDPLYQLIEEKDSLSTQHYTYDSLHNRRTKNHNTYTLNLHNQITTDGEAFYQYDPNGNLIEKRQGSRTWSYTYDPLNRLTTLMTPDGEKTHFFYDPFNRLVTKKNSQGEIHSIYDGQKEIGNTHAIRVLLPNTDSERGATIGIETDEAFHFVYHDPFGNIALYHDEVAHYTVFGETDTHLPWGFCGKRYDEDLHLISFGLRYYSPSLGRWVTQDPIGSADGPNLYAYVHNNPLTHTDAFGLFDTHSLHIPQKDGQERRLDFYDVIDAVFKKTPLEWGKNIVQGEYNIHSKYYHLGKNELPSGGIGYINGVRTSYSEALKGAHYLSELSGGWNVAGVYNPTRGVISDCVSYLADRFLHKTPIQQVRLQKQWDLYFENRTDKTPYLQVAYSRGCSIVKNALTSYNKERRQHIIVLAISPASYISPKTCKEVSHLRSKRDIIPLLDPIGLMRNAKTVSSLTPEKGASLNDHSLFSPTYTQPVSRFLKNYIKEYSHVSD